MKYRYWDMYGNNYKGKMIYSEDACDNLMHFVANTLHFALSEYANDTPPIFGNKYFMESIGIKDIDKQVLYRKDIVINPETGRKYTIAFDEFYGVLRLEGETESDSFSLHVVGNFRKAGNVFEP